MLIKRCYNEENIHWLVTLKNNVLNHYVTSAYNNSEGFRELKSIVNNTGILVKEWNDYTEVNYFEKKYEVTKGEFNLKD